MGSNPTADTPRKCKHHVERFQLFHSPHLFPMFACRFSKFPLDKHTRTRGTHSFAWKCWLEKRKTVYVWFRWENKKHTFVVLQLLVRRTPITCLLLLKSTNGLLLTFHICAGSFAKNPRGRGTGGTHVLICAGIVLPLEALCKFLPTATKRDSLFRIVSLPEWLRGWT